MDGDAVALIIVVGGVLALAALVVLFTINCIVKRQHQEEVAVGAAVVSAVGVAAIALTILDGGHRRARDARPQQQGGRSTTVAAADRPECALCLGELEDFEEWVVLTMCPHEFHRKCLAKWLAKKESSCPTCRAVVWPGVMRETPALADMV